MKSPFKTKKYYAFKFWDSNSRDNCTTGTPHPITGRMSIAGENFVFDTKEERDNWVNDCFDNSREACSLNKLRSYNLGCFVEDFITDLTGQCVWG